MSLEKWSIEKGWILCKIDGLQCSINGPQFKRGTTLESFDLESLSCQESHINPEAQCVCSPFR